MVSKSPLVDSDAFLAQSREILLATFGFEEFRDGQSRVLRALADGEDALVIMPTGSGKSLCYQVPALVLPGVTVVVSPLIALMKDQVDALQVRGLPATYINSALEPPAMQDRLARLGRGEYKLVYVAPERFRSRAFCRELAEVDVALLAVDEAHCISEWGTTFVRTTVDSERSEKSLAEPE